MNQQLVDSALAFVQAMHAKSSAIADAENKEKDFVAALCSEDCYHGAVDLWSKAQLILAVAEVEP